MALDRGGAVKRRLAAILSADAAGYSRLMGDDEVATVRNPAFTVTGNLLPTLHYKRAGDLEHHRDSLSMAGLPG